MFSSINNWDLGRNESCVYNRTNMWTLQGDVQKRARTIGNNLVNIFEIFIKKFINSVHHVFKPFDKGILLGHWKLLQF